ncbi:MAG: hypothetical protein Q4F05_14895 [bacterium]|nr:hypothetical protein [bacterium]
MQHFRITYEKRVRQTMMVFIILLGLALGFIMVPGKQVAAAAFAGGDGSKGNPYRVTTASQLNEIRNYSGKYFVLMNDIDLSTDRKTKEWKPIPLFSGTIDGNGHTIKKLKVNQPGSSSGFISAGTNITVKNIKFVEVNISGRDAGAVIGFLDSSYTSQITTTISNCEVSGKIQGEQQSGGIIGKAYGGAHIKECVVTAELKGENAGGIAGQLSHGTITKSKYMGNITLSKDMYSIGAGIAAILGERDKNSVIDGCEVDAKIDMQDSKESIAAGIVGDISNGTIRNCKVKGEIISQTIAGGILGRASKSTSKVLIENCENSAQVTSVNTSIGFAGGIVGDLYYDNTISSCNNYGTVTGMGKYAYVGGITGRVDTKCTIKGSNNYGKVICETDSTVVGGIVGHCRSFEKNSLLNNQLINCVSFGEIEAKEGGSIGGSIGKYANISACYYVQNKPSVVLGIGQGMERIGKIANPVVKLGTLQAVQSQYAKDVTITLVSSQYPSDVEVKDNKLYGASLGKSAITYKVTIQNGKEQLSYTMKQYVEVTRDGLFSGGEGTKSNPYLIKTANELQQIGNYPGACYKLVNDIDLSSIESFRPIGSFEKPFTGSFDGNGYVIKGLTVTRDNTFAGLFGMAVNATVKDIYLEDVYITTGQYAGAVVAYAYQTEIADCIVNGEIAATSVENNYSGLIVGYMDQGSLKNSCGVGDVKAAYAGVFAGYINTTAVNCYWYTPYGTKAVAQGTSQMVNAVKKIDLGLDTLKVGEVVGVNVKAKAVQPTTNFALYGTPVNYAYLGTSNANVVKISNKELLPVAAGTANVKVTVTFKNGKSVPIDYKVIVKKSIEKTSISGVRSQVYNNRNLTPGITVMDGKTKLTSKDYTVAYTNNRNPGTAVITITGKGNYVGTKKVAFTITIPKGSEVKSSNKANQVKLTWKKVNAVDGYEIYFYSTKKSVTVKTNSYIHGKLKAGTTYKYKVRAFKVVNGKRVYGSYSNVITVITKPAVPTVKLQSSSKAIKISWNKVSSGTGYEIYMASSKAGKYSKVQEVKKNKITSYTKKKLTKNKTYYFKVRSYKMVSGKKLYSEYSVVKGIRVK